MIEPHRGITQLAHVASDQPLNVAAFPKPPEWTLDALCAETDPEAFFPEKGGSTREAVAMCRRCPVAAECLDFALEHSERFGIWGGLTERNRRPIEKSLKESA